MKYNIENKTDFFFYFIKKYKEVIKNKNLKEYLEMDFGTNGWQMAFNCACDKTNNVKLKQYCEDLNWYEYDSFSCEISKEALKYLK